MERRLSAILAADVAGFSRLMGADEAGTLERLKLLHKQHVQPCIRRRKGRVVKLMGDGLLAEFPSIVEAVQCAVDIQDGMLDREPATAGEDRIALRIGVNLGDVMAEGDDIFGDGVNIAARLETLSEPGGICISGKAHDEIRDRTELHFTDMGEQQVKNIERPVRAWQWMKDGNFVAADPARPEKSLELPDKPSIAVLPFDNMSNDPDQEYFSDGVAEDIITALSSFRSIFVIARNSSFVYKGSAHNISRIGKDLGVRYVLEGSVRKSADRVRITAQLIEAASGAHLWAQRYDRVMEDVFELQDEITETIVAAIHPELELAERERARSKPPENLDAWESCQRGMWHSYKMKPEEADRAESYFHKALSEMPNYAPALAGLAWIDFQRTILHFTVHVAMPRDELVERGLKNASAAVQIEPNDAFAQFVFGRLLSLKGEFEEAIERIVLATQFNPNYAIAYHGLGYALAMSGRASEAVAEFEKALRLSPKDSYRFAFHTMLAFAHLQNRDYEAAVEAGRRGMRDNPHVFWSYTHVASALGHLGRKEDATRVFSDLLRVKPDFSIATVDETIVFKYAAEREHYVAGLHLAGMPA